ncbi:MAG: indolepyruvate ferredoxin oxidoreductase subunit alpha [Firmicutes bacterium]|nr:indolepyruvate ferredoxin oxidoreductase subunit alpha [Bacillota bacterium]
MKELLIGNEAVAYGAILAGVACVSGYPGTPSTEVLETIAKKNPGHIHVEWSVNEKAGLEVAAGAAYAGARSLVTMKQVGLNVASDPLMCVNYIGVKGGMVIYVADDPGPISSQTEQDTRHFAKYAKMPVFDCSSPEEAFFMVQEAFEFSERRGMPVILRSTTRVCHSCASIEVPAFPEARDIPGFEKDKRWVIFPRLSYMNKKRLFAAETEVAEEFSAYRRNEILGNGKKGIACGGDCFAYVMDAIEGREEEYTVFKVATPYPFPKAKAEAFMANVDSIAVFEELDPVIEDALIYLGARDVIGKHSGDVAEAGELSSAAVAKTLGISTETAGIDLSDAPELPMRPPVLCAGCPHRASFYAVKKAMKGKPSIFCGDIGCYTLGNAMPLDMVDTCLCMGAGITVAQGLHHADKGTTNFAFVGDSTFFASGITGVINAVYNKADMVLIVLDNHTTAMTGHQQHPGLGITVMNEPTAAIDIEAVLKACGVSTCRKVDPFDQKAAIEAVKAASEEEGVRAIIFRSPCIAVEKPNKALKVDHDTCIGCGKCIRELGCPAMSKDGKKSVIDPKLCTGCGLCSTVCPKAAIGKEEK